MEQGVIAGGILSGLPQGMPYEGLFHLSDPSIPGIYLVLFLIILLENGVPPMIWLPGDSLLFLSGILAAEGLFDLPSLFVVCCLGAFLGYQINYLLGSRVGLPLVTRHFSSIITEQKLEKSRYFYSRWGNAAISIGRFFPVIRTIIPFLAGISRMDLRQFTAYNILGAMFWPPIVAGFGYLCGVHPWLDAYRDYIIAIVAVIFVLSIIGPVILILCTNILAERRNGS
jgi:membrane-associated protein